MFLVSSDLVRRTLSMMIGYLYFYEILASIRNTNNMAVFHILRMSNNKIALPQTMFNRTTVNIPDQVCQ